MTARERLPNRRQCESFEFPPRWVRTALTKDHDESSAIYTCGIDKPLTNHFNKGAIKMTIADILHDAAEEIRDTIAEDGLEIYGNLAREIMCTVAMMETLSTRIDNMGSEVERIANEVVDREIAAGRIIDLAHGRLRNATKEQHND